MTILIRCTSCEQQLRVPEEMRGREVRCPSCDLTFTAPWDGTPEEAPPPPDEDDYRPRSSSLRDHDDDDYRPRRRRKRNDEENDFVVRRSRDKPGKVQAIAVMTLVGGIIAVKVSLAWMIAIGIPSGGICCLWPGIYYSLVVGILCIIKGAQLLGQNDFRESPPQVTGILQIINIINGDVINCVLGILVLVFLSENEVRRYYRGR